MATEESQGHASVNVVEATIHELRSALNENRTTAVEIAAECLHRIAKFDSNGPRLNSIPVLSSRIFEEALASDERRTKGCPSSHLDGIPYTVKDSYQVKDMIVANGSPALMNLVSNKDAFAVQALKEAGAVMIGRTNMPPMAAGGMQRGLYGRAENPYNSDYLAAAFASGSSNGSAVSTAASFAAFGLGSETVSSGRSPASNNALVAYTPSKGYVSIRGVWPLYPTCDDLVPHTRSVDDMLELLDVIAADDPVTEGDFWRDQPFLQIPKVEKPASFRNLPNTLLSGLRIAVPSCYVGGPQLAHSLPVHTSAEVITLWHRARLDLEAQGAEIVTVEGFPLVEVYENPECAAALGYLDAPRMPDGWNSVERGTLIARTWNQFLRQNADPSLSSLNAVDATRLFPAVAADHPQIAYAEPTNAIHYSKLKEYLSEATATNAPNANLIYATPQLGEACQTLEALRKVLWEDWLTLNEFDLVVFPAAGDVGKADADVIHESGRHAWMNGVKYSNGNRAMRHLGVPTVTVPMGNIESVGVPVGLTFCGPAYSDTNLLAWARAFETATRRRTIPTLTPHIDTISLAHLRIEGKAPKLLIELCETTLAHEHQNIKIRGSLSMEADGSAGIEPYIEIFIDGHSAPEIEIKVSKHRSSDMEETRTVTTYNFEATAKAATPRPREGHEKTEAMVTGDRNMIVILGSTINSRQELRSRPSGWYALV